MGDEMDPTTRRLVGNFDAQVWAEEFVQMVKTHPNIPTDTGTMIGWFANAIMAGYDEHTRQTEGLREIVEAVADDEPLRVPDHSGGSHCPLCEWYADRDTIPPHALDCPYRMAREWKEEQ